MSNRPEQVAADMWRTDPATVGPAGPAGPIDLDHLARQTMGDRALAKEVLELFLGHSTAVLCRLKAAPSGPERREAAHALVGSARGIGAFAVARLAGEVEKDIAPDVDLAPLDAEIATARRFIADFIGKG